MCQYAQKTAASLPDDAAEWEGTRHDRRVYCSAERIGDGKNAQSPLGEGRQKIMCDTPQGCAVSHIATSDQNRRRTPA